MLAREPTAEVNEEGFALKCSYYNKVHKEYTVIVYTCTMKARKRSYPPSPLNLFLFLDSFSHIHHSQLPCKSGSPLQFSLNEKLSVSYLQKEVLIHK